MKAIPPIKSNPAFNEYSVKIDVGAKYVFCDVSVFLRCSDKPGPPQASDILPLPDSGIYCHEGVQIGVFKVPHDGEYPFYEADELNDPDLVLVDFKEYFEGCEPLDYCRIDSACIAFIPVSLLPPGIEPMNVGPVVDFARFDEDDYEDSSVSLYTSSSGIYVIDYFLARDLSSFQG